MHHRIALGLLCGALALGTAGASQAREPLNVVTSFSVLADMVEQVGGEHVAVTSLVGPDSDSHVYSPSPADARRLAQADLVVFNGLQFEGWMNRLLDAGNYQGVTVTATDGIEPLAFTDADHGAPAEAEHADHDHDDADHEHEHDHGEHAQHASHDEHAGHEHQHGDLDPHAWLDVARAEQYVANIRDGLAEVDPQHAEDYRTAAQRYLEELDALDAEIRELMSAIPAGRRSVVTGHDAFEYFGEAYDVRFLSPVGLNTAAEPAAAELARLVDFIQKNQVKALFYENITSPALIRQLAEEADLKVAGTLYSGALASDGEASTYVGMMRHNAQTMHDGLSGDAASH
ncbi:zinc ABC transporter substrate-binding protein [Halomonas sp. HP20-15]|uniref:metal ABC transporter solute-binding protein, Zn/Mn family n=1 Tax=Halomonas sp. HP20-15 TaxID=3085901 RepID=UPI0029824FEB|nr:zinc ABC transporter substrate-binding protein [Halomonas sp. HP20-15]MDW5378600.1 zinc ABC transporter substrate-binding protein [Halomonas sp. HP20-15]